MRDGAKPWYVTCSGRGMIAATLAARFRQDIIHVRALPIELPDEDE